MFSINLKHPVFGPFLVHFPNLGGKENSRTISYGFLAPCQNLEKTNDTIPRKYQDRTAEGWTTDGVQLNPYI